MDAPETRRDADAPTTAGASQPTRFVVRRRQRLATFALLVTVIALVLVSGLIFVAHGAGAGVTRGGTPTLAAQGGYPTFPTQSATPTLPAQCLNSTSSVQAGAPTLPAQTRAAPLTQTKWKLTGLIVEGCEEPLDPWASVPTLKLVPVTDGSGRIEGGGPNCNIYGGTYTLAGDTLRLSGGPITRMYCNYQWVYFTALQSVRRYRLDGITLTLSSADGSMRLIFRAT